MQAEVGSWVRERAVQKSKAIVLLQAGRYNKRGCGGEMEVG